MKIWKAMLLNILVKWKPVCTWAFQVLFLSGYIAGVLSSGGCTKEPKGLRRSPWPPLSFQERLPCSFTLTNFVFSLRDRNKWWPGLCVQSLTHTYPGPFCRFWWAMWFILRWEHHVGIAQKLSGRGLAVHYLLVFKEILLYRQSFRSFLHVRKKGFI